MSAAGWIATACSSLAASVLVNAGMAKLASPAVLRRALGELLPNAAGLRDSAVRLLAVIELVAGLGLLALPTRTAASLLVAGLGLGFASMGAAGWLSGSRAPCGCFGGHSDRPLGGTNVLIGFALAAVLPINLATAVLPAQSLDYSQWALVATSLGSLLTCLWLNRRLALSLLGPAAAGREDAR